ncbi:MAG: hypothetical protein SVZ03_01425 [Spirochaetota bacterium]|nr:hypothetical protein [Spirochaetota bacterium]
MKNIFIPLFTILIFIYSNESNGFVNQRHGWWKTELKNLNNERISISNNNKIEKSVLTLVDNEIERTQEMLKIFENINNSNDPLAYQRKRHNEIEIKECITKILDPLFSLYYMEYLVKNIGERQTYHHTVDIVQESLSKSVNEHFNQSNKEFQRAITNEHITKVDWKYLSMETFVGRMMMNRKRLSKNAFISIEKSLHKELMQREFNITPKELGDIILSLSSEYLDKLQINNNMQFSQEALFDSNRWHGIYSMIVRNFEHYKKIIQMFEGVNKRLSLQRAHNFYKNPIDLENTLFKYLSRQHLDMRPLQKEEMLLNDSEEGVYIMNIPDDPNMPQLFKDMDNLRKKILFTVTGSKDNKFYSDCEIQFDRIIMKYLGNAQEQFSIEGKRLFSTLESLINAIFSNDEDNKTDLHDKIAWNGIKNEIIIANERKFFDAKKIFKDKVKSVNGYKQKSIDFLRWVSDTKEIQNHRILEIYRRQTQRNISHLNFIKSLVKDVTEHELELSPPIMKRLALSIRRTNNILNFISYSHGLHRKYTSHFKKEELTELKKMKRELINAVKITKHDINSLYSALIQRNEMNARQMRQREKNYKEMLAEFEIEFIWDKVQEYAILFDSLTYSKIAFINYSNKFTELIEQAKSGNISNTLQYSIKEQSIISVLKEFNVEKIRIQYETKRYLKRGIERSISRIMNLLKLYKRNNIVINNRPAQNDIKEIRLKLSRKDETRIADWRMNESNFAVVDKKLIKKLIITRNRRIWDRYRTTQKEINPQNTIIIRELDLSLSIPDGWEEKEELKDRDYKKRIIRSFISLDDIANLYIVKIPKKGRDARKITDHWLKETTNHRLKERWGKKDGIEYLWTLSRDNKNNIMEIYTIPRRNYAIILTGSAPRDKYKFFRHMIGSMFRSIRIGLPPPYAPTHKEKGLGML